MACCSFKRTVCASRWPSPGLARARPTACAAPCRARARMRPWTPCARALWTARGAHASVDARSVAGAIFDKLAGFASYGFCRSHAAAFALIAWQTLWLKQHHPAAFYCALLNAQPMGFYSPEVIVGDMQRHGIALLPPDVNHSGWGYGAIHARALRMGVQTIAGLGESAWARVRSRARGAAVWHAGRFLPAHAAAARAGVRSDPGRVVRHAR